MGSLLAVGPPKLVLGALRDIHLAGPLGSLVVVVLLSVSEDPVRTRRAVREVTTGLPWSLTAFTAEGLSVQAVG